MALAASMPIVFAACGCNGGDGDDDGSAAVVIELVAFKPEKRSVDAGATVTWQQKDTGAHTVTSGTVEQGAAGVTTQPDGRFESGEIAGGATFEFTFTEAGTYRYFCRLHPATMRGAIHVR